MKRKLEELNLLDDFLFGSVMSYPEIGEAFSRKLLKILLDIEVEKIQVVAQKTYYGSDTDQHGTRLDVYIEEDGETGTIYDVEPDKNDSDVLKKALPRHCKEDPDMEYDDGAATIFFYTKGKIGAVSEKARKLLAYMECSTLQNADNEWLREIHQMVEVVRHDKEVSLAYMKAAEHDWMIREQGEALGRVKIIRNMRKTMNAGETASVTGLDPAYVERIFILLEKYPEENEEEITARILSGNDSDKED